MARILLAGLAFGLFFNILGWMGNSLWLGEDWEAASVLASAPVELPYSRLARELISLLPDFIYGLTMVWLYSKTVDRSVTGTAKFVAVYWLATVAVVYLAIVNSGFLPWQVSTKTSILALVLFIPTAWLLPRLIPASGRPLTPR